MKEAERAECQRQEERDIQLLVFQMIYSQGNNTSYPNSQYYPGNNLSCLAQTMY